MTLRTNGRIAGITFLLYIATGLTQLFLSGKTTGGAEGTAAQLASIAQHATLMGVNVLLGLLQAVYAIVLAVTLYALTRDADRDLAMLGLCFRTGEGVLNAASVAETLALMSLATASTAAAPPDVAAMTPLVSLLRKVGVGGASAFCFAVGSTLFSFLFLRARSIPSALAWLGVIASILLVVLQPAQLAGFLKGPLTGYMWMPMLLFELSLALWLIFVGVKSPQPAGMGGAPSRA